ncbi:hypothetical protein [Subtercola vilae]
MLRRAVLRRAVLRRARLHPAAKRCAHPGQCASGRR